MALPLLCWLGGFLPFMFNKYVELPTDLLGYVSNSFTNVFNLDLFSWCKDLFLIEPLNYITDIFGVSNNAISYIFAYWCSISIIWLVFDLLMYVPNLVHTWLDRGAID